MYMYFCILSLIRTIYIVHVHVHCICCTLYMTDRPTVSVTHVLKYIHVQCVHIYTVCTYMYMYMYTYIQCIHVYMYMYMYIAHTHTHTHECSLTSLHYDSWSDDLLTWGSRGHALAHHPLSTIFSDQQYSLVGRGGAEG